MPPCIKASNSDSSEPTWGIPPHQKLRERSDATKRRLKVVRHHVREPLKVSVRSRQFFFRPLQPADIEIDAGPTHNLPVVVSYGNASGQDWMILAVHTQEAVLDIPGASRPGALFPCRNRTLRVVRMQHTTPSELRALCLGLPHQTQKGRAGVNVVSPRVADPHAIVDHLADGAVDPLAVSKGPLRVLTGADVGEHYLNRGLLLIRNSPSGRLNVERRSVEAHETLFDRGSLSLSRDRILNPLLDDFVVVGMDEFERRVADQIDLGRCTQRCHSGVIRQHDPILKMDEHRDRCGTNQRPITVWLVHDRRPRLSM
jgi:hypothetical protein